MIPYCKLDMLLFKEQVTLQAKAKRSYAYDAALKTKDEPVIAAALGTLVCPIRGARPLSLSYPWC